MCRDSEIFISFLTGISSPLPLNRTEIAVSNIIKGLHFDFIHHPFLQPTEDEEVPIQSQVHTLPHCTVILSVQDSVAFRLAIPVL